MKEFFENKKEFFEGLDSLAAALTKFSQELNSEISKEMDKLSEEDQRIVKNKVKD